MKKATYGLMAMAVLAGSGCHRHQVEAAKQNVLLVAVVRFTNPDGSPVGAKALNHTLYEANWLKPAFSQDKAEAEKTLAMDYPQYHVSVEKVVPQETNSPVTLNGLHAEVQPNMVIHSYGVELQRGQWDGEPCLTMLGHTVSESKARGVTLATVAFTVQGYMPERIFLVNLFDDPHGTYALLGCYRDLPQVVVEVSDGGGAATPRVPSFSNTPAPPPSAATAPQSSLKR